MVDNKLYSFVFVIWVNHVGFTVFLFASELKEPILQMLIPGIIIFFYFDSSFQARADAPKTAALFSGIPEAIIFTVPLKICCIF